MDTQQAGRPHQDSHHAVDIASLAQQLMQDLAAARSSSRLPARSGGPTIIIHEVRRLTRDVDPAEYDPHHVAIGPYNRTNFPVLSRDDEKVRCLDAVLSAARASSGGGTRLEAYLDELAGLEEQARSCYADKFDMTSESFVRMLLLDACYLLVRFTGVADGGRHDNNGRPPAAAPTSGHAQGGYRQQSAPAAGDKLESVAVVRDALYLAENQIPFFVVKKVHELTFLDGEISAAHAFGSYIGDLLSRQQYSEAEPLLAPLQRSSEPGNLLHLLLMHFKPSVAIPVLSSTTTTGSGRGKLTRGERVDRWRTATEYCYTAGVQFKKRALRHDGARCILDVRLSRGGRVLEIPRLNIDAETWRLLRNLMALEQRNPEATDSHVTAYCVFLSQLACTPGDVELLSRSGVVAHGLGNDAEVAGCFADLCKGIAFNVDDARCNYLRATCLTLDRRFRSRHGRWMAWLRQKYFRNPWLAVGLAAAVLGLVCTVVQALYSVLSYRQAGRG